MNAFAGIVWWNAVSNTTTIGVFGISAWHALIPIMFAGLWSGASLTKSSRFSNTSSLTNTDFEYFSPPWTTLCPTAEISSIDFITPCFSSTKVFKTKSIATWWSLRSVSTTYLSLPSTFWVKIPSIPILSTNPCANTASLAISINWYFNEELPQFITKIFILKTPF